MVDVKKGDLYLCEDHITGVQGVVVIEILRWYKHERFGRVVYADSWELKVAATMSLVDVHRRVSVKMRDGRKVRSASAVPINERHWRSMRLLRGKELDRWRLLLEM